MKIGLQLYTIRNTIERDGVWPTMDALATMGYRNLEHGGGTDASGVFRIWGQTAEEIRKEFDARKLKMVGLHVGMSELEQNSGALIRACKTLNCPYVILPWVDISKIEGGWPGLAKRLGAAGKVFAASEIKVCYHNHDFEFRPVNDRETGYDQLWQHADPKFVFAELDTFWVKKGGQDVLAWMKNLRAHMPIMHFKDMGADGRFTEVGSGNLPWDDILARAKDYKVQYAHVENDDPQMEPLESVRRSREFLLRKGLTD